MQLELFIYFDGTCRAAVEFYAGVFQSEVHNLMTYGQMPADPNFQVKEIDRDRVMYAGIPTAGMTVMFMDVPSDSPITPGDNIIPTINVPDKEEVTRLFNELKAGGEVLMELQPVFFSEWYGMVKDKFGIRWQILHYVPANPVS
jgi:PhnB protein